VAAVVRAANSLPAQIRSLLAFETNLKSDYAAFLDRVLARDTDAAVAACVENHAKMADFVESTVNRSAEGKHRSRMAARS
jgi:hypothetical protein